MAATDAPAAPDAHATVAREKPLRPRAGAAAIAAGILAFIAGFLPQSIYSDAPHVYVLDSLRDAAGQNIGRPGLTSAQVLFVHDKAGSLLVVAVAQALTALLVGVVLVFLFDAASARGATTPRLARLAAMFGAVGSAVAALMVQIGRMVGASDFASSADHGSQAARDALNGGAVLAGGLIGVFAGLALAAAFVMIAIGAMRVGLLTRFIGVLGAIVGVLFVLGPATGSTTFVVQTFWLIMVGVLLFGSWPGGAPPAWADGQAHPWPSQQQRREEREAVRADAPVPATPAPAGTPSPATSARKKRKRRG